MSLLANPWAIVTSDGNVMRTIHPAALTPAQRAKVENVLFEYMKDETTNNTKELAPANYPPPPVAVTNVRSPLCEAAEQAARRQRELQHGTFRKAPDVHTASGDAPAATATMTQSEISRSKGYTGDCCQDCGNFTMLRNGSCLKCDSCGSTTGCS